MPWRRRVPPSVLAALGYVVVTLALLWPSIRPGHTLVPADAITQYSPFREDAGFDADNPIVSDAATQFFPWLHFLGEHVRADGDWPEWNPLILSGVPTNPNGYVNLWYPPTSLARVLSPFDAYNAYVVLHLVIAALGIYALSRTMGARPWSSWIAGLLALAAGAWLHWSLHLVHVAWMVWLPWALAAGWRAVERPTLPRTGALALVLGAWWLGGNPQYTYFGTLAFLGWAGGALAWRRYADRASVLRPLAALGVAGLVGAAIAAPTLLPAWNDAGGILRSREREAALVHTHLPLRHGVRVLVPDAVGNPVDGFLYASGEEFAMDSPFVGVVTVVLAGTAIAIGIARRDRRVVLLTIGAAAALALAFFGPPHGVLRLLLPGYDRFRGSARWVAVLPAFALPLAALGLDRLAAGERRARRIAGVVALGIAAVVAVWLGRELLVEDAPHAYLARRAAFAVVLAGVIALAARRPRWMVPVAVACAAVEVVFAVPRWFPDVVEADAYPWKPPIAVAGERGGRFARVGGARELPTYLPPDIAMVYGVSDISGLTPLFPTDYDRYLRIVDDYGVAARELNVAPPLLSAARAASPLLDPLDVRTLIGPGSSTAPRLSLGPAAVVREAAPATASRMWAAVEDPSWNPAETAAVEGLERRHVGVGGTAERVSGREGEESWIVDAPAGGFFRIGGRYDDGWEATVDGARVTVHRADGVFRGVTVPPGRHRVVFRYVNGDERNGLTAAAAGLVFALLLVARRSRTSPEQIARSRFG